MSRVANPPDGPEKADSEGGCCNRVSNPVQDEALTALIQRWPDLPPAVRAGIVAMVEAATRDTPQ